MYAHAARSVAMLCANPSYTHEQRAQHLRGLVKDLTTPLPPRLEARAHIGL